MATCSCNRVYGPPLLQNKAHVFFHPANEHKIYTLTVPEQWQTQSTSWTLRQPEYSTGIHDSGIWLCSLFMTLIKTTVCACVWVWVCMTVSACAFVCVCARACMCACVRVCNNCNTRQSRIRVCMLKCRLYILMILPYWRLHCRMYWM